jgi:hypothetical protein
MSGTLLPIAGAAAVGAVEFSINDKGAFRPVGIGDQVLVSVRYAAMKSFM